MSRAAVAATRLAPWVWGAAVAWALTRFYFRYAPGEIHLNHEMWSYVYRMIEFTDLLRNGYWSPQWATHFRGGAGSPYFGYYQPGFFYVAALFTTVLPLMKALAVAVWTFALVGYGGVLSLVRGRFGVAAGVLAGTMLLLATYVRTELYWRGDLSEFAGMMTLAPALAALVGWLEDGGWWRWVGLALGAGALVVFHPVAGLAGYGTLAGVIVVWALATRSMRRPLVAAAALVVGAGLATFYWLPLWLEWSFVQGANATKGGYEVTNAFLSPLILLGIEPSRIFLPTALGVPMLSLVSIACGLAVWRWRSLAAPQRRLVVVLVVLAIGSTVMVTSLSSPIWESVSLLALVQFPWRLLMVQAVVLSALAGCITGVPRVVLLLAAVALVWPLVGYRTNKIMRFKPHTNAGSLQVEWFAPDTANEWLPTGAVPLPRHGAWHIPTTSAGTVGGLQRSAGYVRADVVTESPATVTLPHYYFPAGWLATLDGEPVPISSDARGLMVLEVPRSGLLELRFTMTPARRAGLWISGATLLGLVCGVALQGRRRRAVVGVLMVVALGTSGCGGAGYLLRGGLAEARILLRREPIADLLARPDLDADLRERLGLVLDVRRFAETELGLTVGKSYTTFAEVDGEATVWVLSAAHRDRLEAYTWWYPIVGRVPYQGYFEREQADRAARALAGRGFDVDVRPASAFSTLGWFADPVLSTTIKAAPVVIAETVIHELFHATLYVPSAVPFNESAAMFVGHRGAAAFFCDGPRDAARCSEARHRWRIVRAHGRVLERYVRRLRALYASPLSPAARQRARAELAGRAGAALARRGLGSAEELSPPNNARLLAMLAYETDLGTFDRLASSDAAVPEAIARIVGAVRGASDPFAAVRALDTNPLQTERTRLDSTLPWRPSISRWTPCSGDSPAGCGSSATTWRMGRTCTDTASSRVRDANGG
jgi:predicted aminopeptidase